MSVTGTLVDGVLNVNASGSLTSLSTEGGEVITIDGTDFGPAYPRAYVLAVRYGSSTVAYVPRNCSFVTPHRRLQCLTAPGVGTQLSVKVRMLSAFYI